MLVLCQSGPRNESDNSWGSVKIYVKDVGDVFLFFSPNLQRCPVCLSYGRWPGLLLDVLL